MILANAILVLPDRLVPQGWVAFSDEGIIVDVGHGHPPRDPVTIDLQGNYLSPGFIDLHIHGAMRRDTMEASNEAFAEIAKYHASGGTTSVALTTISAPIDEIIAVLQTARNFPNDHVGARVLGIHLEGPYFSPEKPGAHSLKVIHAPTDAVERIKILDFADTITQMTLAPELDGAMELIEMLSKNGIIASGGHSNCWAEEAEAARVHGMSQVTHTFNCMSSARKKGLFREAGLVEYAMSEPEILCELIADGTHVSPVLMRALYQAKGGNGIILITDATAGAGLADGETYPIGEFSGVVRDGVGLLQDGSAIAGSTCRMIDGVRNLVELVEVPLVEAVRMATYNPAKALRKVDSIGELKLGNRADMVVFSPDFVVLQTWVGGKIVYTIEA